MSHNNSNNQGWSFDFLFLEFRLESGFLIFGFCILDFGGLDFVFGV